MSPKLLLNIAFLVPSLSPLSCRMEVATTIKIKAYILNLLSMSVEISVPISEAEELLPYDAGK